LKFLICIPGAIDSPGFFVLRSFRSLLARACGIFASLLAAHESVAGPSAARPFSDGQSEFRQHRRRSSGAPNYGPSSPDGSKARQRPLVRSGSRQRR